jgi:hypothetical protein
VESLIEQDIFSPVRDSIQSFANEVISSSNPILLVSKPNFEGSLSLAPIEAALLDARIPYKRRFSKSNPDYAPFIQITDDIASPITELSGLSLSTTIVDGLRGRFGDFRKGPLSAVAQAHVLAMELNPQSLRLRRMRPWMLSGNWINEALDTTYDPVYSSLRDHLSAEGSIRVIPAPEVPNLHFNNYPWLEPSEIEEATREWGNSELENREKIMERLVRPVLHSRLPSTSRTEELLWHCVLGSGWETDMASQISLALNNWENNTPIDAASIVADSLVSTGEM